MRAGTNRLELPVTNTLPNHVAELKQTFRRAQAARPLEVPPSGLMGPVRIIAQCKVMIDLAPGSLA